MCLSSPKMPTPKPPPEIPQMQDSKLPDVNSMRKRARSGNTPIAGGTLLTGPSGVENNQLSVSSGGSLLGG